MKALVNHTAPNENRSIEIFKTIEAFEAIEERILKNLENEEKYLELQKQIIFFEDAAGIVRLSEYNLAEIKITVDLENQSIKPVSIILLLNPQMQFNIKKYLNI